MANARTAPVIYRNLSDYQGVADSLNVAQADLHAQGGGWLIVDADYSVVDSFTIPAGVNLRFRGGLLTVASGKTLTHNGRIEAPAAQIFAGAGTVVLNGEPIAPLEWFGGVNDNATDNTAALTAGDACYNASTNGGALVANGRYAVAGTLALHAKTNLILPVGARVNVATTKTLTVPGTVVAWEGSATVFAGAGTVTVSGTFIEAAALTGTAGGDLAGSTYPNPVVAAGAITAAKIAANTITAGQLANGAVGTAQIAANAVTLRGHAIGTSGVVTTTSTAYVDLPDMVVTLVLPATADIEVWLQCDWASSAAGGTNGVSFALSLDGAAEVFPTSQTPVQVNYTQGAICVGRFTGVAAGSHTIKGRWQVITSGTATAQTTRRVLLVEAVMK